MQWYRRGRGRVKGLCDDAKLRKKVDLGLDEKKAICCRRVYVPISTRQREQEVVD